MTDQERLRVVTSWLNDLADLTRPPWEERSVDRDRIALYATTLQHHVNAFTADSLAAVAAQCKTWPAFGVLRELLADWWRAQQDAARLPPPRSSGRTVQLTALESAWLQRWHHHEREGFANAGGPANVSGRAHMLALLKEHARGAWLLVSGETDHRDPPTPAQEAYVAALVATLAPSAVERRRDMARRGGGLTEAHLAALRRPPAAGECRPAPPTAEEDTP